ncbi:MAG: HD domain-containing protein [Ruminococcaceae bacterium]|nr:HD domain-containing protein [Oscillospiraceae bacterium]
MEETDILLPKKVAEALTLLERHGYEAYVVGGCVRDSLLGRAPNDWDITTSARPEEMQAVFDGYRVIETGIRHGTLSVLIDGMLLEITTYRSDGEYLDNRHPSYVTFSRAIEDDLSRRDFTVNAMAYHPVKGLVDLFGGRRDLDYGIVRCVGNPVKRFREDGLRILRAIRFSSVLDFFIDKDTEDAILGCAGLLSGIASERIREEFCKLLCGRGAVRVLRQYVDVVGRFIPEVLPMIGFDQNTKYHCYDVFEHTLHALDLEKGGDLLTRLSILFHDIGKPLCYTEDEAGGHFKGHAPIGVEIVERVMRRLRFDNDSVSRVMKLVELHDLPIPAETRSVRRLMTKLSEEDILRLMELKRCDRLAHAEFFRTLPEELSEIPRIAEALRNEAACLHVCDLAIDGTDLITLGMKPGKELGEILRTLFEDVLEERLENEREVLLSAARQYVEKNV